MTDYQKEIAQKVSAFIAENSHADTSSLQSDTLLFKEGIFDSMGFVLLVDFLEDQFSLSIDDSDFTEENFESVKAICTYVEQKVAVKAL
ncbi:acyl carrier protein [Geofilum rhodophaeum]|uniref:acyl carrier protein n=1 Tax=Geofilum rhodophaeum TaxID=1965019 RepID=UPI000B521A1E|nr:acyl carrier protein [Geofilum rhodophaeum]